MIYHGASLCMILQNPPHARAYIQGSPQFPDIRGTVVFYQTDQGVIVATELKGLPRESNDCDKPILAFHIHEGNSCSDGNAEDSFADVGGHYNPADCPHPYHAGDMPPIFSNSGYALQLFLTDRFDVNQVMGKTIILHSMPDDFTTQPSGNAGKKIACGEIRAF